MGSEDLGAKAWVKITDAGAGNVAFYTTVSGPKGNANFGAICDKYATYSASDYYSHDKSIAAYGSAVYNFSRIYIYDSAYTEGNDLRTSLSGVMLYYELETPIETDISSLLSDDNLIEVEPGGTISFPSSLGDNYRLPVPSDVEYTIDLAPDAPAEDGTYTLQCTVADGVATYEWVSA